ncbi:unnamed protein product [Urochloa decumbens]|uniref:CCHC-type domain-containing protein n=1 Tax=Urochloa decumbens TaxID=240449 RepID=A0ABC9C8A2_9POAL
MGYTIKKPILRRKPGRPRKSRFKAADEPGSSKQRRCPECHELGHTTKKCQGGLTAKQKRSRLSSDASEEGSNDPTAANASSTRRGGRGRGRAPRSSPTDSSNAGTSQVGEGPPSGRGRGRGRGVSRTAAYFNV